MNPHALFIMLRTPLLDAEFKALIDSGSSHCFIDSLFCTTNKVPRFAIPPIGLRLFDGSSGTVISECTRLEVHFPSGDSMSIDFYITPLDSTCSAVLGYNWLSRYNPLIDWVNGHITFRSPSSVGSASFAHDDSSSVQPGNYFSVPTEIRPDPPVSPPAPAPPFLDSSSPPVDFSAPPSGSAPADASPPSISFIGAAAFAHALRAEGSTLYKLTLSTVNGRSVSTTAEPPQDFSALPDEYRDYADVFSAAESEKLAPHRLYDLKIDLENGAVPPPGPIYSLSQLELTALREFLDKNVNNGFIRQSTSPHGAPVLFVKKKSGDLRLCVDFRALNRITRKDRYPLPLISDLLDAGRRAKVFTKIDLKHAYHLVRIAEGEEWKTAFRTRYGSFEWTVMPEGLTNAPAAFQRFMNDLFKDLLDVYVVVYLDDILIYSENASEHRKHVREVLRRLRAAGLFASLKKCVFNTDTVEFLGYIISPAGLAMDSSKVATIQEWPVPRKVRDVQSFLGFANFYRRFIADYSDIVVPLTRLTRKAETWVWSPECQRAFDSLKKAFTTAPILSHWIPGAQLIVETDASDYAIGAILSLISPDDGEVHPIAFHSRTMSPAELNYDTHDKELLAIFEAFKTWRRYLEGAVPPVDVITDHKNLEYFSTTKLLTRRQARWSELLSAFNFVLRFRPGRLGGKPDALTRRWDVYPKEGDSGYALANPHNFRPVFTQSQLNASLRASYFCEPVLRAAELMDVQQLHADIRAALSADPIASTHLHSTADPRWVTTDGLLLHNNRIWVPDADSLRVRVLRYKHDHQLSGHLGQNKTLALVRQEYVWPGLRDFVKSYVRSCVTCRRNKYVHHRPYGFLRQLPVPERPWDSISMDFIEKLPLSHGFTSILVIVDRLSKMGLFIPTVDEINATELARLFLLHVFSKHGVPQHITCDRGSEFTSHFFRALSDALGIKLHFTAAYHPPADGQTERVNQTLEQYLRMYCSYQQDNWSLLLPLGEFAYNNAPNATTGTSPFFANKGYNPSLDIHTDRDIANARAREYAVDLGELHQFLRDQMTAAQARYQGPADARCTADPIINIGDEAFVHREAFHHSSKRPAKKFSDIYYGPYEVIAKPGPASFTLRLPRDLRHIHPVFHVSHLEPAVPNTIPNRTQPLPPPVEVDGFLEWEVEEILDSKIDRRRRYPLRYKVKWFGYDETDDRDNWVGSDELPHAQELVADYHERYPNKPGPHSI